VRGFARNQQALLHNVAGCDTEDPFPDQLLLLPEAVDDYVGTDNPVLFTDAFVDGLDLAAAGLLGSRRRRPPARIYADCAPSACDVSQRIPACACLAFDVICS